MVVVVLKMEAVKGRNGWMREGLYKLPITAYRDLM
jgi:hypothetical protein